MLREPLVFVDEKARLEVVNALQALRLEVILHGLDRHWIILLHALLHLRLHVELPPVLKRVQFLLLGLDAGEVHAVLVK